MKNFLLKILKVFCNFSYEYNSEQKYFYKSAAWYKFTLFVGVILLGISLSRYYITSSDELRYLTNTDFMYDILNYMEPFTSFSWTFHIFLSNWRPKTIKKELRFINNFLLKFQSNPFTEKTNYFFVFWTLSPAIIIIILVEISYNFILPGITFKIVLDAQLDLITCVISQIKFLKISFYLKVLYEEACFLENKLKIHVPCSRHRRKCITEYDVLSNGIQKFEALNNLYMQHMLLNLFLQLVISLRDVKDIIAKLNEDDKYWHDILDMSIDCLWYSYYFPNVVWMMYIGESIRKKVSNCFGV